MLGKERRVPIGLLIASLIRLILQIGMKTYEECLLFVARPDYEYSVGRMNHDGFYSPTSLDIIY